MAWARTEPILRKAYALMEGSGMTSGDAVCDALGMSEDDARADFDALDEAGYIDATFGANGFPQLIRHTEKGLQHCSGWPTPGSSSTFMAEFLSAIDERASDATVPAAQRGRLRRLWEAAQDAGPSFLADVAAKVIEHQAGL